MLFDTNTILLTLYRMLLFTAFSPSSCFANLHFRSYTVWNVTHTLPYGAATFYRPTGMAYLCLDESSLLAYDVRGNKTVLFSGVDHCTDLSRPVVDPVTERVIWETRGHQTLQAVSINAPYTTAWDLGSDTGPPECGWHMATPTIVGAYVFFSANFCGLLRRRISDGAKEWRYEATGRVGCESGVAVSSDSVFALFKDCTLHCVNFTDGALRWKFILNPLASSCYLTETPVLWDNSSGVAELVFAITDALFAIHVENGTLAYQRRANATRYPLIVGDTIYFGQDNSFVAMDAPSGREIGRLATTRGGTVKSSPVLIRNFNAATSEEGPLFIDVIVFGVTKPDGRIYFVNASNVTQLLFTHSLDADPIAFAVDDSTNAAMFVTTHHPHMFLLVNWTAFVPIPSVTASFSERTASNSSDLLGTSTLSPIPTQSSELTSNTWESSRTTTSNQTVSRTLVATSSTTLSKSMSESRSAVQLAKFAMPLGSAAQITAAASALSVGIFGGMPAEASVAARALGGVMLMGGCADPRVQTSAHSNETTQIWLEMEIPFPLSLFPGFSLGKATSGGYLRGALFSHAVFFAGALAAAYFLGTRRAKEFVAGVAEIERKREEQQQPQDETANTTRRRRKQHRAQDDNPTPLECAPLLDFLLRVMAATVSSFGVVCGIMFAASGTTNGQISLTVDAAAFIVFVLAVIAATVLYIFWLIQDTSGKSGPYARPLVVRSCRFFPLSPQSVVQRRLRSFLASPLGKFLFMGKFAWQPPSRSGQQKNPEILLPPRGPLAHLGVFVTKLWGPRLKSSHSDVDRSRVFLVAPFYTTGSLALNVIATTVIGAAMQDPSRCQAARIVIFLVSLLSAAIAVVVRPFLVPAKTVWCLVLEGLGVIVTLIALPGVLPDLSAPGRNREEHDSDVHKITAARDWCMATTAVLLLLRLVYKATGVVLRALAGAPQGMVSERNLRLHIVSLLDGIELASRQASSRSASPSPRADADPLQEPMLEVVRCSDTASSSELLVRQQAKRSTARGSVKK